MDYQIRVLQPDNINTIIDFENGRLEESFPDEMEREFARWQAQWRPEALDHYLALGWSFGLWEAHGKLIGYFLAQPFLFFTGMTQILWLEHLSYIKGEVAAQLVDLAYRMAREKNFQKVILHKSQSNVLDLSSWKAQTLEGQFWEIKTTKYE